MTKTMTDTSKPVNVMVFLFPEKRKIFSCKNTGKRLLFSLFFVLIFFVIYVLCLYAIFRMWIIRMLVFRMRFFRMRIIDIR